MTMGIQDLVNCADLASLKFGVATPARSGRLDIESDVGDIDNLPAISWSIGCSIADMQHLTSCDANATCAVLEGKIYREFKKHVQLDADKIYKEALERYHRNATLLLGQSAETCVPLGLLTEDCTVRHIPTSYSAIYEALKHGPLIVATNISEGWRPVNLLEGGMVDERWPSLPGSGHATCLVAFSYFENQSYFLLQNSWGSYPPMGGLTAITCSRFLRDCIDDPVIINFSSDWISKSKWENFVVS